MNGSHWVKLTVTVAMVLLAGCPKHESQAAGGTGSTGTPAGAAATPAAGTDAMVKVSQFGGSLYCSIARGADGTLHAIYTDRAEATKPSYLYYRASRDGGTTWSEPKNLSDDESGLSAYFCRVAVDGKGRTYAVWKYLTAASDSLDGPGSACCGILAYRCLDGGAWSKTVRLSTKQVPSTSFFTAVDPGGKVNLVWAQGNPDVDWWKQGGPSWQQSNWIRQAVLDGPTEPKGVDLFKPKPLMSMNDYWAAHAAGHDYPMDVTQVHSDGVGNLRGYVDASGLAHFIGDHVQPYPNPDRHGPSIQYYDGKTLRTLFEYPDGGGENNCDNPWTLLVDAKGKEHVIRAPNKSERACVRDYPVENGQLGEPTDVVISAKPPGGVIDWQAVALPGGRMAVACALSQTGGWDPDDTELCVTTSAGDGKWSTPVVATAAASQAAFVNRETAMGAVAKSEKHWPAFADLTDLGDGHLGLLMVDKTTAIIGVTNNGVTGSGRVVGALSSYSTASPWVMFRKL